tara:strand:+ start:534 stop:1247 length:714 start_codon:yes stop_codon:yes gene_type:complete
MKSTKNKKKDFFESDFRFERKFVIEKMKIDEIKFMVKLHPFAFSEIYNCRFVNNIYFDSFSFKNYKENIEGSYHRFKIRVRWYGELFGEIRNPILEIKIKNGLLGKKISLPLKNFHLNRKINLNTILGPNIEIKKKLNIDLRDFKPKLLNRYKREYYLSYNKKYRITIDDKQIFYNLKNKNNLFLNYYKNYDTKILEIKYEKDFDNEISSLTSKFPFRLSKNSKYLTGIQRVWQLYN